MISDEWKKQAPAAVAQVLREVTAECIEGKRVYVNELEIAEEVLRRIEDKTIPRLQ